VSDPLSPRDSNFDITTNHYWRYHGLEALLECKQPVTDSADEDLFIAVHQICELAFHQMILDLERTLAALATALAQPDPIVGETGETRYFLARVLKLYGVVNQTLPILRTMRAFAEFRTSLGPTSGFQSFQFRHLEIMCGVPTAYWQGGTSDREGRLHPAEVEFERQYGEQVRAWLERHRSHSLTYYYCSLRERAGGELALLRGHSQAAPLLAQLAALEVEQRRFHRNHLALAAQQLEIVGATRGTGGTAFQEYLAKYEREVAPLFPGLQP